MAQLAAGNGGAEQLAADNHCHVIDIDVVRTEPLECAVCMEPLEWVAIGPCGHREVCSECTTKIRFVERNHRCCFCRELCPTVIVTKAGGGRRVYTKLASLATFEGGGVGNYWYHRASATYFDDEQQYKQSKRACLEPEEEGADENDVRAPCRCPPWVDFLLYLTISFLVGMTIYAAVGTGRF